MKFSALNVDFDGPSLDFYVLSNLRTRASESGTPEKKLQFYRCWAVFRENGCGEKHRHAAYHNKN